MRIRGDTNTEAGRTRLLLLNHSVIESPSAYCIILTHGLQMTERKYTSIQ